MSGITPIEMFVRSLDNQAREKKLLLDWYKERTSKLLNTSS